MLFKNIFATLKEENHSVKRERQAKRHTVTFLRGEDFKVWNMTHGTHGHRNSQYSWTRKLRNEGKDNTIFFAFIPGHFLLLLVMQL